MRYGAQIIPDSPSGLGFLTPGGAQVNLILSWEEQTSPTFSGLVADGKFLPQLHCAFWRLGPWKMSVVLNYSETHISSVSKKSTPTGEKCQKLFIALCFKSGVGSRVWEVSPAAEDKSLFTAGFSCFYLIQLF